MGLHDVYQIVDTMKQDEQKIINVYFYRVQSLSVSDNNAQSVVNAFVTTMIPLITACQGDELVHTSVKATNLFDATDAYETLISVPGDSAGADLMGTFEAYPFRLVGNNAAVRSGAKRIGGVAEGYVTQGVVTDAGQLANLSALADGMAAILNWGLLAAEELAPVIVKRILVGDEYELPTTIGDAILSFITDAIFSPLVTSQVSRKVGRGD